MLGRRTIVAVIVAAACLGAAACDSTARRIEPGPRRTPLPTPTATDSLVIGLVGTMSGEGAWRGEDAVEGADAAVHLLNRGRSEGDPMYELVGLDDRGDPARALALIQQLAASEQTIGIVYAGPPEALPDAEPALAAAGIPAVIVFGDLYSARLLSAHVFQMTPPLLWQSRRLASYLADDRGYRDVGLLVSRSFDGRTAVGSFATARRDVGARDLRTVAFAYQSTSFEPVLERLQARGVEAIVFEGPPAAAAALLDALDGMGARYRSTAAARIASAPARLRKRRVRSGWWHPHVVGFDLLVAPGVAPPSGTVAAETYARGAHLLPLPGLRSFRAVFADWWDARPFGWEARSYDAVRMLGWAAESEADDLAEALEGLRARRFSALPVTFGPDDHTAVEPTTIGLWTVPGPGDDSRPVVGRLPWVPLARGFAIGTRGRTTVLPGDWRYLFRDPPPPKAPAPPYRRMRFAITTGPTDRLR